MVVHRVCGRYAFWIIRVSIAIVGAITLAQMYYLNQADVARLSSELKDVKDNKLAVATKRATKTTADTGTDGSDTDVATYGIVDQVLAWVSDFDTDGNALLCSDELRAMPDGAGRFVPYFKRFRSLAGGGRGCLRYMQIEAGLFKLSRAELDAVAKDHTRHGARAVNPGASYKFQGVPDYERRAPWPFVSQEGLESAATFTYHGEGATVSGVWSPDDVKAGDVISVRGPGVSQQFWRLKHPKIRVRYIVLVSTEAEDVTPGVYHVMAADDRVGVFYTMNHDEQHAGQNPKFQPVPIGQLWKTRGRVLLPQHRAAPPWAASGRKNVVLWMLTARSGERQSALSALKANLGVMLQQRAHGDAFQAYKEVKFVASPFGAGPDCHRTWEVLAMGAVPIVRDHAGLRPLFVGQPVIVVKEWSDVTKELLKAWTPPPPSQAWNSLWLGTWYRNIEAAQRRVAALHPPAPNTFVNAI